jgi:hypothetical protein
MPARSPLTAAKLQCSHRPDRHVLSLRVLFLENDETTVPRRVTVTKVFHRAVCAGMFFASESAAKKHTGADGLANTPNFAYSQSFASTQTLHIAKALPTPQTVHTAKAYMLKNELFQRLIHQLLDHAAVILALRPRRLRHQ